MVDILIVFGSVVTAGVVWNRFIDPWLDRRPRKAIFVKPSQFKKKSNDKIKENHCA